MHVDYEVVVADESWRKIEAYIQLCDKEIAAFGYVTAQPEGYMYVDEVFLVPQEVSAAEVDFIESGLPYAIEKATKDGRLDDLRFCVHSHVNMKAFWSATDEDMIEKIGSAGTLPWFVSAVFNKSGDCACRLDLFSTGNVIEGMGHVPDIALPIRREGDGLLWEECAAEIKKLVKPKQFKAMTKSTKNDTKQKRPSQTQYGWADDDIDEDTWPLIDVESSLKIHIEAEEKGWSAFHDTDGMTYYFDEYGNSMGDAVSEPILEAI